MYMILHRVNKLILKKKGVLLKGGISFNVTNSSQNN